MSKLKSRFRGTELQKAVISVVIGLLLGTFLMLLYGYHPIEAYKALFKGAFSDLYSFAESLANATPLILTALTFAIGLRGGMFNIGAEGQVYIGALTAVFVTTLHLPAGLDFALSLILAAVFGALWALIPAILKITRGVHEVISTIMFNWIATYLAFFMIAKVLVDPARAEKTISIAKSSRFPLLVPGTSASYGIFVAVFAAFVVFILLWRTVLGFHIRVAGYNPKAAQYAGIERWKVVLWAFLIGGITAGLAGAVHVMGRPPTYAIYSGMPAITGLGFSGLAVSMIGRNHPIGIIIAGIFFGGLLAGGRMMQISAKVPFELVNMLMGLIVIFLAVPPEKLLAVGKKAVEDILPRKTLKGGKK